MNELKLTDLPAELQSLVISKLCDPTLCSRPQSKKFITTYVYGKLSDDLLHAAQASSSLSKAVISAIGPHAQHLSFVRTKWLWKWITILKDHVKAVSFSGIRSLGMYNCNRGPEHHRYHSLVMEEATLKTLKALDSNETKLEGLYIEQMPSLFQPQRAQRTADYLTKAVQRNSSSLRMISLKADQVNVQAMRSAALPKLEVVEIVAEQLSIEYEGNSFSYTQSSDKALCQILKALHTRAHHITDVGSVRVLSLRLLDMAPTIKFKNCRSLFLGVKVLNLSFRPDSNQRGVAKFISNFKNLESLDWSPSTEVMSAKDMTTIFTACHSLTELNLAPGGGGLSPGGIGIPRSASQLNAFFRSFQEQLQTANFGYLTSEQIKALGECCPKLTNLFICIDQENVEGLSLLLENHCRQLQELHICRSKQGSDWFGLDNWSALSNAVRNAPPCFHTFSLIGCPERATEHMVCTIVDILELMGNRTKSARFNIGMKTKSALVLLKGLYRILKSTVVHCKSVENLCFDFVVGFPERFVRPLSEKDRISRWYGAVCEMRDILSAFEHLEKLDLGEIDAAVTDREGENYWI